MKVITIPNPDENGTDNGFSSILFTSGAAAAFLEPREHDARYAQASGYMVLSIGLQVDHNSAHRLHRRNLPYPEEYRYGPERPPPPNFCSLSRASERAHTRSASSVSNASSIHSISESREDDVRGAQPTITPASARLSIIASASGSDLRASETTAASLLANVRDPPRITISPAPSATAAPTRGLELLNTIFASSTPPPNRVPSQTEDSRISSDSAMSSTSHNVVANAHTPTAYSQDHHILSPKSTTSALPRVLNREVISTLLGLPPSRASSARYEGDNEASDDGASEPGSRSSSIPQLAYPPTMLRHPQNNLPTFSPLQRISANANSVLSRRTHQVHTCESQPQSRKAHHSRSMILLRLGSTPGSDDVAITKSAATATNLPRVRPLVPFETDWPYPRAPLVETDSEIVKLDFADTSALSDPSAFEKQIEKSWDVPARMRVASPPAVPRNPPAPVNGNARHPHHPPRDPGESSRNAIIIHLCRPNDNGDFECHIPRMSM
ncbi:hypothetical protein EDD15DRAFT_2378818 [Pisolithus albus]|nr:hypothetical protein EDD15DRAFT_2378818 [Pisolithus albus]